MTNSGPRLTGWFSILVLCVCFLTQVATASKSDTPSKQRFRSGKHWCLVSRADIVRLNLLTKHEPLECERKAVSDRRMTFKNFLVRQWKCRTLGVAGKTSCVILRNLPTSTQFWFILFIPACISMMSLSLLMVLGKLNDIQALDEKLSALY